MARFTCTLNSLSRLFSQKVRPSARQWIGGLLSLCLELLHLLLVLAVGQGQDAGQLLVEWLEVTDELDHSFAGSTRRLDEPLPPTGLLRLFLQPPAEPARRTPVRTARGCPPSLWHRLPDWPAAIRQSCAASSPGRALSPPGHTRPPCRGVAVASRPAANCCRVSGEN